MGYDDLKQTILRKIDSWRDTVKKMIQNASKGEDWEEICDEITFIIQAYGSIMMIDHLQEVEQKFDEEVKGKEEAADIKPEEDDKSSDQGLDSTPD